MASQRTNILDATKTRLNGCYGPSGTEETRYRKMWRRAWRPGNDIRPALTVVDNGQRRGDTHEPESVELILGVQLVIDLEENWDRQVPYQDWGDHLDALIGKLENWMAPYGITEFQYQDDDLFTVLIMDGASQEIWVVNFDVHYFKEVELKDNFS